MDSNKIHIDELVRQRLTGGEEEPRSGAWITMRELLDKQMPTRPLGGMAWGKAARWTTGLVLLTLLAGGYGAMEIRRQDGRALAVAEPAGVENGFATSALSVSNPEKLMAASEVESNTMPNEAPGHEINGAQDSNAENNLLRPRAVATNPFLNGKEHASSSHASTQSSYSASRTRTSGKMIAASRSNPAATSASNQKLTTSQVGNGSADVVSESAPYSSTATTTQPTAQVSSPASAANNLTANASVPATRSRTATTRTAGRRNTQLSASRQPALPLSPAFASPASAPASNASRNAVRQTKDNTRFPVVAPDSTRVRVQRDTVRPIRIAHRYLSTPGTRAGRYVTDTVTYEPVVLEKIIPLPAAPISDPVASVRPRRKLFSKKNNTAETPVVAAKNKAITASPSAPASASPAATSTVSLASGSSSSEALVPLSSYRVSSKKSSTLQYTAHEQLQDVVRRTRFSLAQMRLYTGVTGGFNGSFGGTSMGGFHVGLFGLLAINERWSMGIEGKFVQRFNRGTELHDPYFQHRVTGTDPHMGSNGQAYNVYRVTSDSFEHYYKVSTLETVELPVYLRYTYRRFHGFAGANLTYGLGVKNVEGIDRIGLRTSNRLDTVLTSQTYTPPTSTVATVGIADFGPRFGLGYTAGVGYQATPSVLVDVRMTQLVWDNRSNTAGGLQVSQTFYRVPSLQLSIGYRFSQRMGRK